MIDINVIIKSDFSNNFHFFRKTHPLSMHKYYLSKLSRKPFPDCVGKRSHTKHSRHIQCVSIISKLAAAAARDYKSFPDATVNCRVSPRWLIHGGGSFRGQFNSSSVFFTSLHSKMAATAAGRHAPRAGFSGWDAPVIGLIIDKLMQKLKRAPSWRACMTGWYKEKGNF